MTKLLLPFFLQKLSSSPVSLMNVAVMVALFAFFCLGGAADIGSLVAQLDDPLMKEIIGSMQTQIEIERKDKEALPPGGHAGVDRCPRCPRVQVTLY